MVNFLIFLVKRLIMMAVSLVVIIAISYTLLAKAPGNFMDAQRAMSVMSTMANPNSQAYQEQQKLFEERYGLDKPLYVQIWTYTKNAVTFNFGPSFQNPTVMIQDMVRERLPRTLTIVLLGIALALLVGIPLGVIAVLVFAGKVWNILPNGGWRTPSPTPRQLVLPVLTLALGPIAGIARFTRNQVAETLSQEFIRTARAKGVPESGVILRHALRNSLIPVVTTTAPQIAFALVGSVWIENIFRIPGIGQLFQTGLAARDYPLVITSAVILALGVMIANMLADITYSILDPRIKLGA